MHVRTYEKLLMDIWWSSRRHLGVRALDIALTVVSILIKTSFVRFFSGPDSFIVIVTATDSSTFDDAVIYYVEIMRWMLHRWRVDLFKLLLCITQRCVFQHKHDRHCFNFSFVHLGVSSQLCTIQESMNSDVRLRFQRLLVSHQYIFNVAYCMGVCSCVMIFTLM